MAVQRQSQDDINNLKNDIAAKEQLIKQQVGDSDGLSKALQDQLEELLKISEQKESEMQALKQVVDAQREKQTNSEQEHASQLKTLTD